jgi:HD-GYP domain-containing protein (c-di-GMP phosphodiesterase class II)
MKPEQIKLQEQLSKLTQHAGPLTGQHIDNIFSEITELFQQLQGNNQSLADELLACYDQLNIAFETINTVANCMNITRAIHVLAEKISQTTNSCYSYYLGTMSDHSLSSKDNKLTTENVSILTQDPNHKKDAQEFFQQHEEALRNLTKGDLSASVSTIGYNGDHDYAEQGQGNVLALRLRSDTTELGDMGTLIFVRSNEHELFVAVEKNLAATMTQMGCAVLSNIIYVQKLHRTYLQTISSLVRAMEAKDTYTGGHSARVAKMACQLGRHINLDKEQIELIEWAGLLHDIGKIGIREEVLCKTSQLTDEEFQHIRTHPIKSYEVLEPLEALKEILAAVRHHHEHFDGTGYPDGLKGTDIPLHARILQIADIWDALTSTRPYRQAIPQAKAMEIMRNEAGTTTDPELAQTFLKMLNEDIRIIG